MGAPDWGAIKMPGKWSPHHESQETEKAFKQKKDRGGQGRLLSGRVTRKEPCFGNVALMVVEQRGVMARRL